MSHAPDSDIKAPGVRAQTKVLSSSSSVLAVSAGQQHRVAEFADVVRFAEYFLYTRAAAESLEALLAERVAS